MSDYFDCSEGKENHDDELVRKIFDGSVVHSGLYDKDGKYLGTRAELVAEQGGVTEDWVPLDFAIEINIHALRPATLEEIERLDLGFLFENEDGEYDEEQ